MHALGVRMVLSFSSSAQTPPAPHLPLPGQSPSTEQARHAPSSHTPLSHSLPPLQAAPVAPPPSLKRIARHTSVTLVGAPPAGW